MTSEPVASTSVAIPVKFQKPPRRILGIIICRHSWRPFWKQHADDDSVSVEVLKCTRCLRERSR